MRKSGNNKSYFSNKFISNVYGKYYSGKGIARLELDSRYLADKLGKAAESVKKVTEGDEVAKKLAEFAIKTARKENVIPFKNEYKLRKRKEKINKETGKKSYINDYYKKHYYMKKKTEYVPIESPTHYKSSLTVDNVKEFETKKYPISGTKKVTIKETRALRNKDGSLKHKTNGMLATYSTYRSELQPVYNMKGTPTVSTNVEKTRRTEKITHGTGTQITGYRTRTTYRQPWKEVQFSSLNKKSLYAQGKAYFTVYSGLEGAKEEAFADRPPHLRDSGKAVKYGKGVYGITYNVKKPKNDYFIGDSGGESYAAKQYYAEDANWNRFANEYLGWPTTSHWLEVAFGLPVSNVKVPKISNGKNNYNKLVKMVAKELQKRKV